MIARYYQELLNYFTREMKDRDSAADIVQEAYVRVLSVQSSETISQPRALLFRTARNLVIDRYRRSEVRGEEVAADEVGEEVEKLAAPAACEPETAAASSQTVSILLEAIEGLPTRCREAFILHRFDGLSHADVAAKMGISRKMVEQHIKNAMEVCRRCKEQLEAPMSGKSSAGK